MQQKQIRVLLVLANITSIFIIFAFHQGRTNSVGIEAIQELGFYIFIPAVILLFSVFITYPGRKEWLHFTSLLAMSLIVYIMATHSGAREGVSLFDQPMYLINLISAIGIIALRDID